MFNPLYLTALVLAPPAILLLLPAVIMLAIPVVMLAIPLAQFGLTVLGVCLVAGLAIALPTMLVFLIAAVAAPLLLIARFAPLTPLATWLGLCVQRQVVYGSQGLGISWTIGRGGVGNEVDVGDGVGVAEEESDENDSDSDSDVVLTPDDSEDEEDEEQEQEGKSSVNRQPDADHTRDSASSWISWSWWSSSAGAVR
jgi:hypothetical protein